MKIDKIKVIQIAGVAGSVLSVGASILNTWVTEQKIMQLVDDRVKDILSKKI